MTTDITELAQREKFESWAEEAGALPRGILKEHRNQDGSYPGPHYTYMWKAWQAASAELVEALEKAQQHIAELGSRTVKLVDCGFGAVQHMSGGSTDYCHGFVDGTQNAIRAITAAGIKWETE